MKFSKYNLINKDKDNNYIIYNTKTAGVIELDQHYSKYFNDYIETNQFDKKKDLLDNLRRGGMIVSKDMDETNSLKVESLCNRFNSSTLSLTIAPTLDCNFRCPYCYEKGINHHSMNAEVQQQIINFVQEHSKTISNLSITWYGGEPLLEVDTIRCLSESFIKICNENSIKYSAALVTNGYYLNEENIQILEKCNIKYAQVTIDGDKATHDRRRITKEGNGTYDIIMNNVIKSCKKIRISIRINVDRNNIEKLDNCINDFVVFKNNKYISFYIAAVDNINESCSKNQCFSVDDFSQEEVNFYQKALQKGFLIGGVQLPNISICGAVSLNSFVIDPKGDLYKCWNEVGRIEKSVGNILNHNIRNNKSIEWLSYDPFEIEECINCEVFPVCMGGCPYYPLNKQDNKCKTIKHNSTETVLRMKEIKFLIEQDKE